MTFKKEIYFCSHCKKIIDDLGDLLFIEDKNSRGFCSDECIEDYYAPLVLYFESTENDFRKKLRITDENCMNSHTLVKNVEIVLKRPQEIWKLENQMGEEIYSFIGHFNEVEWGDFFVVCLCYVLSGEVSFVFLGTATSHQSLVEEFRFGEKIEDMSEFLSFEEVGDRGQFFDSDANLMMEIERKKGTYLAELLEKRSASDIPFESFHLYDSYLEKTLTTPDEILTSKDCDGDDIFTYISSHDREGVSFFFLILLTKDHLRKSDSDNDYLIPIISFPTVDGDLYHSYKKGTVVTGGLKN